MSGLPLLPLLAWLLFLLWCVLTYPKRFRHSLSECESRGCKR